MAQGLRIGVIRASEVLISVHPHGEKEQPCDQEPDATVETFGGKFGVHSNEVTPVTVTLKCGVP